MEKTDVFAACDSLLRDAVQLADLQGSFALMHIFSFICKMQEKIFSPPIKDIKRKKHRKTTCKHQNLPIDKFRARVCDV
jgi:hypothetical protein